MVWFLVKHKDNFMLPYPVGMYENGGLEELKRWDKKKRNTTIAYQAQQVK
jgi:hypothetical protein